MGRRGCRVSDEAGILSGWACILHGMGTVGRGHGSAATQRDVSRRGWQIGACCLERGREEGRKKREGQ